MKAIWKFSIHITDRQWISIPVGAHLLTAQSPNSGGGLAIWAVVDDDAARVQRQIVVRGTGHPIEGDVGTYVATVQQGPLVWHVFDCGEAR